MLMQRSLAKNIGELEELTETLRERGEGLRRAYVEAQKADRMKTSFLHNMTNQMIGPAEAIVRDVAALSDNSQDRQHDTGRLVGDIHSNGNTITDLLKNLINISDDEKLLDEVPMNEEEINGGGQTR
jgi:methyl-accepting chemotaxis protein